ncbi:hypothetical protein [Microvirga lotononidis]|uniref:BIG2 domain-containing protein n=1 Tax=Microvirga lotononidis TaxID=864069 RepID=I4YP51_9HYPH|nr:hypothetical protein [Microvirga lotononidis]EIM25743.1 hypothetical protein MicloDRAFT_00064700 [Microvirga lotononidis]WQO25672.1 hypothetical protein U0023_13190 [Microvirga lotononidis]
MRMGLGLGVGRTRGRVRAQSAPATTWNAADKAASVDLTNGNLTATKSGANGQAAVRSASGKTSGKWVAKFTIATLADITQGGVGFANASYGLNTYLGSSVNDIAYYLDNSIWYNGGDRGDWTGITGGSTARPVSFFLAIDIDGKLTQASFNGTDWSTTVNPFDITTASPTVFVAAQLFTAGDSVTLDTKPTGWTLSGFSNWG